MRVLATLNKKDLADLIAEGEDIEVKCDFCNTKYTFKTEELKEKIIAANEKGKISIKNIVDETSSEVKIILHLSDKTSSDKMIDALYALNICEKRISPYCSVIKDK